jgi:hypothetical protein
MGLATMSLSRAVVSVDTGATEDAVLGASSAV